MKRVFVVALLFFISSCNNSNYVPKDIIKPAQMQNIFWDMIRGEILAREMIKKDSTLNMKSAGLTITEKIFAIYNIDRIKFERSLDFYEKHPALMKVIFDSLHAVQTRKNSTVIEKKLKQGKDRRFSPGNLKQ